MEGKSIYDDSLKEINKIAKSLSTSSTNINWEKLDAETKSQLNQAVSNVIYERKRSVESVVLGVK